MKKTLAVLAATAVIAAGGVATAGLMSGSALAQEDTQGPVAPERKPDGFGAVQEALAELVDEGVITQEQADAVAEKLRETRAAHRDGRPRLVRGFGSGLADALGMTTEELRAALAEGATIAELAADVGVDVDDLIDQALAAAEERLAQAVESGRIDQATADERLEKLEDRLTKLVNGELDFGRRGRPADGAGA